MNSSRAKAQDLSKVSTEQLAAEIRKREQGGGDEGLMDIVRKVSAAFRMPVESIMGHSRRGTLAEARFGVWLILRDRGYTAGQIADCFGRDDSGTVRHGCARGIDLIHLDKGYARKLREAMQQLDPVS